MRGTPPPFASRRGVWRFVGKFSKQVTVNRAIAASAFSQAASTGIVIPVKAMQAIHVRNYFASWRDHQSAGTLIQLDPMLIDVTAGALGSGPCVREYQFPELATIGSAAAPASGGFTPGGTLSLNTYLVDDWYEWDDYFEFANLVQNGLVITAIGLWKNTDAANARSLDILETALWDAYELDWRS